MTSKIDSFLDAKRRFEEVHGYPPTVVRVTSTQWDDFVSEAKERGLLTKSAKCRVNRIAGVKVEVDDRNARVNWNPITHGTGLIFWDGES